MPTKNNVDSSIGDGGEPGLKDGSEYSNTDTNFIAAGIMGPTVWKAGSDGA